MNTLLSGDEVAVFRGLERRGVPGETVRVRLEIFLDKVGFLPMKFVIPQIVTVSLDPSWLRVVIM